MIDPPPELPGGQDDPPDVRTAVHAAIRLLRDIGERADMDDDLKLRLLAMIAALVRLRKHLQEGG